MNTRRHLLLLSLLAFLPFSIHCQVAIDLTQAKRFVQVERFDLGGSISRLAFNERFCGVEDLNVITTGVSGRGRVTWSTIPRIDTTNLFNWFGINAPTELEPIDYDGVAPFEYVNSQGVIWRCSQGESPFPLMPIDTVANAVCSASPAFSGDVDGDGSIDVITEIGRNGVTTRVILGGPAAGKGCERVLVVPVVRSANKYNQTKAFYQGANGEWRMIQQERDSIDRAPRLQMYRVNFTRTAGKPEVTFTALGAYRGVDVSQIDEPFGDVGVISDTRNGIDHMLFRHRIGEPGSLWALERFIITDGQFVSSGEVVTGYEFASDIYSDFQYDLGTARPTIKLSSIYGPLFCLVDDITHPIAIWDPSGSGTQPVLDYVAVNDQTGDGVPDLVVVGGSINGTMVVLTLDSASTSVTREHQGSERSMVTIEGTTMVIRSHTQAQMFYHIATVDGRVVYTSTPCEITPGEHRVDLDPVLHHLGRSVYFVRVTLDNEVHSLRLTP